MVWNSEKDLHKKAKEVFLRNEFNFIGHSIPANCGSVSIDLIMEKENKVFLVEVNNGTKVNMNDISDLKIAQINYPKQCKFVQIILTDRIESVDGNVRKIAKKEKIKIMDVEALKKEIEK